MKKVISVAIAPVVPVNQTPATTSQSLKSVKVSGVT